MKNINLIAAIGGSKRVLGKDNQLLWKIPGDLPRFKQITTGHPIIMGRKTFESCGAKPLPNRTNIIVTRNADYIAEGCAVVTSLSTALADAEKIDSEIFVIGGGEIYTQALPLANRLYLTVIEDEKEGDTFFPDYKDFHKIVSAEEHETPDGIRFSYLVLEK